jgi:carbon storage regulator
MLILTRRAGETVMIGSDITITVLGVKGNQVRMRIQNEKASAEAKEESPGE